MTHAGSSIPRRQLGRYLKQGREEAGLSLEAAGEALEWSRSTMYRIEGGGSAVKARDVTAMCVLYGMSAEMTSALIALAAETKANGWWHAYGDTLPTWFELYVGMESAASRLRHWEPDSLPGLLQTRAYAEHLLRSHPELEEQEVGRLVELRMERQKILKRRHPEPPRLEVIVDEGVLRRSFPGMADQLSHLHNQVAAEVATIRIVPRDAPPNYALTGGGFVMLEFPTIGIRTPEPTTVYSESLTGALYLDKPAEVAAYSVRWRALEGLSLDADRSADLLATIAKEM
ncbi:helix-turn-helix domain-containing protein [Micromonospora sp. ALFpr18c]|uniref:helix-turn-helix domain-containing protein n=1 Tax=unclassified Micromonospora TaxID=2617518 RepID=UPI00124B707B|nr:MULTISPECIES: helix-turn-helix transcriptional regulator [unclassified Micromonospora]KAB1946598.1 helix-turn-helix domain-containing protein [Micromonospora sp. ALFpr18c]MDG4756547.1 helix-turn-helix transcriptional regulator [Micromonospora sp. WMMD710]